MNLFKNWILEFGFSKTNGMNKIITYQSLPTQISRFKQQKQDLVLVGGCFDILHLGHVRFLKEAKGHGVVVVALESDQSLTTHKGILRPIHKQEERAEVLASMETVDFVILLPHFVSDKEYFEFTKTVSPKVIAITEGDPQTQNKQTQANMVGAKLISIPKINTPSTTQLAKLLGLE